MTPKSLPSYWICPLPAPGCAGSSSTIRSSPLHSSLPSIREQARPESSKSVALRHCASCQSTHWLTKWKTTRRVRSFSPLLTIIETCSTLKSVFFPILAFVAHLETLFWAEFLKLGPKEKGPCGALVLAASHTSHFVAMLGYCLETMR